MTNISQPSVQSLLIQMRFNGQPLSTGTGFIVIGPKGPLLITNRHNVTGRRQDNNQPLSRTGGIPNEIQIVHSEKKKREITTQTMTTDFEEETKEDLADYTMDNAIPREELIKMYLQ